MIRHIFIGTFKEEISDEIKIQEVADMKAMKEKIPGIVAQEVNLNTGWVDIANGEIKKNSAKTQIVMTVDFATKADFEVYLKHPYHTDYIDKTGDMYFDRNTFVVTQFEF